MAPDIDDDHIVDSGESKDILSQIRGKICETSLFQTPPANWPVDISVRELISKCQNFEGTLVC